MSSVDALDLTGGQQAAVARACEALQPADRDLFLKALAHRLETEAIGDGSVYRAIRDVLGTGTFRFLMTVAVGEARARHRGKRSKLLQRAAIA